MPMLLQIDAFTDRPFGGNPAAVCVLDAPADEAWMQRVAAEMNLAETAFLVPQGDGFGLRWFTPKVEVELCGHATLASAHALWQVGRVPAGTRITFETASGTLTAEPDGDRIAIELPSRPMAVCATPDGAGRRARRRAAHRCPKVSRPVPTAIWSSSSRTKPKCARWRRASIVSARWTSA